VGRDPAAVAVDALETAVREKADVLIVDTAGRLHTSGNLMDELKKIVRVLGKRNPGAPHETLLVLDGTIGQNAVVQAKTFAAAVPVTGLVVTKVDGTAKGGIVVAVHEAIDVPVKFIGTGESIGDLATFDAAEFSKELLEEV
jgi:fused signal recognition particle receptor